MRKKIIYTGITVLLLLLFYRLIRCRKEAIKIKAETLDKPKRQPASRWRKSLPELDLHPSWAIQPVPPKDDEIIRLNIWNKPRKAPAELIFDPKDQSNPRWKVFGKGTKTYQVPVEDTKQLRAVIAAVLQEISPVQP